MAKHEHMSWAALRAEREREPGAREAAERSRRAIALGETIRRLRRARGLSQAELARRAGTGQAAVARLELGEPNPRLNTLERIGHALGVALVVDFVEATPSTVSSVSLGTEEKAAAPARGQRVRAGT